MNKNLVIGAICGVIGATIGVFVGYKLNEVKHCDDDCITERPRGYIELDNTDRGC